MISRSLYQQYVHGIVLAYRQYGVEFGAATDCLMPYESILGGNDLELLTMLLPAARKRLGRLDPELAKQLFAAPRVRMLDFGDVQIVVPIVNPQGSEWYESSPLGNFDFLAERRSGLLDRALNIIDLGGHHGVWAAYYAKFVGLAGSVWSFEPSILNFEVSSLLMLLNGLSNVVNVCAAIGVATDFEASDGRASAGMLIDYVNSPVKVVDFRSVAWRKVDFLKIDIEGFEYELLTQIPWLYVVARNVHLELHIPHLERRGLDYREVYKRIPFDKFDVMLSKGVELVPVDANTSLSGYCSLMLREK